MLQNDKNLSVNSTENSTSITTVDDLLTTNDAAAYLRVSVPTIFRLRQSGKLAFYKIGSRILFSRARHLGDYLKRQEINNTS